MSVVFGPRLGVGASPLRSGRRRLASLGPIGAGVLGGAALLAATGASAAGGDARFDINAIDVDGNTLLDEAALERAIYAHMGPGRTREDVAAAQKDLQEAYRAHGYQSVIVELPRQTVEGGVVRLHVVEASVGRLRVVGEKFHSPEVLQAQIPALAEGAVPDFNAAQAQITESNRLPDRQATPIVKAGEVPGTVDVDLQVADQEPVHGSLELNNDRSAFTTPLRLTANLRYDNLFQTGQSLSFTYAVAPERTADTQVFAGSYVIPLWRTPFSLLLYGFQSDSNLATLGGVDVLGPGHTIGARGIYQFPALGPISQSLSFGLDYKDFREVDTLATSQVTGGGVAYWPLNATYTLRQQTGSTSTLTVGVTANLRGVGSGDAGFQFKRAEARADFIHLNVDIDHTQPLWGGFQANARFSAQVADSPLVSSEQFAAGGLSSVRGYLTAEAVGDDGVFGSLEIRTPPLFASARTWLDELRLFTFVDGSHLWVIKPQAEQTSAFGLYSTGVGARVRLLDHLTGDLDVAVPLKDGPNRAADGHIYTTFSLKSDF